MGFKLNNKAELKPLKRGLSDEGKKVVDYFLATGFLTGAISDDAFESLLKRKIDSLNLKATALKKIGLDEDQLKEIPPVYLCGYENKLQGTTVYGARKCKDGKFRSSVYGVTYLMFSDKQVYVYSIALDLISGSKKERAEEYFYKDITNFSTTSESIQYQEPSGCLGTSTVNKQIDITTFSIIVPGDKLQIGASGASDLDKSVSAMKQKLREKKG